MPFVHLLQHAWKHKGTSCSLKSWGDYLFPDMENTPEVAHCGIVDEDIFSRMQKHSQGDLIVEEDDGPYEKGDVLRSFHYQARRPMSQKVRLANFFIGLAEEMCGAISLWRRHSSDRLIISRSLGLLPMMVCCN